MLTEQMKKDITKLKGNKMHKMDLSQWEEVPDEDLWQDGELNSNQVMDLIYIRVIQEGNWKLIRRKDA